MRRTIAASVLACVAFAACSSGGGHRGGPKVVAAFYPLAWAAERIAPDADVEDLTPAGGEPHDLQLTARQRSDVRNARVVFLLGKGFQPELERAVKDARGRVIDLLDRYTFLPSNEEGVGVDPHIWLDPVLMADVAGRIADALVEVDPSNQESYLTMKSTVQQKLLALDETFRSALTGCELKTLVATHEAFGYLAKRYDFTQLGLTGLTPEAEPAAAKIQHVHELVRGDEVAAIFYEDSDEGRRIGRSVASDVGVPALPLSTLENDPAPHDYMGQMQRNLQSLRTGLRCH